MGADSLTIDEHGLSAAEVAERGKLGFQHTRRAFRFRALQAVRADQLGTQTGFVHRRALFGAHFHKADREPSIR